MVTVPSKLKPFWTGLYMMNTVNAVTLGLYARRRHRFRSDFTYNKYHFGVFTQIMAALGIAASGKLKKPLFPGLLFMGAVGMTSMPAYLEGIQEIKNEPDYIIDGTGMIRRVGIYCLLGGYAMIFFKRRGSLPFLPPKLKSKINKLF